MDARYDVNLNKSRNYLKIAVIFILAPLISLETFGLYVARSLNFNPNLGAWYFPLMPLRWVSVYVFELHYTPIYPYLLKGFFYGAVSYMVSGVLGLFIIGLTAKVKPYSGLSHFASEKEVEEAGLFKEEGVYIGRYITERPYKFFPVFKKKVSRYLKYDLPTHVIMFAPTRSGKGVGFVIPNLLSWKHSMIVNDIKGENYEITAGFRAKELGQKIYYFNPTKLKTDCYNPLDAVREGTSEAIKDAQSLAEIIIHSKSEKQGEGDSHWTDTAEALLTGLILHVAHHYGKGNKSRSIGGIYRLITSPERPILDILEDISKNSEHEIARRKVKTVLEKPEKERDSVISSMIRFLELWADPIVDAATSKSSFSIEEIRRKATTVYLVMPPSDIKRLKLLIRIIITQFVRQLGERMPEDILAEDGYDPVPVCLMIDEFPALDKLEAVEESIPVIAGYGVKYLLITQSLNQLDKVYGKDNAILDNCQVKITYAANDPGTAEKISKLLGETVILRSSTSLSGNRMSAIMSNNSFSANEQERSLLTPGQILQLPHKQSIVVLAEHPPILSEKIFYYKDKLFKDKIKWKTPEIKEELNIENYIKGAASRIKESDLELLKQLREDTKAEIKIKGKK